MIRRVGLLFAIQILLAGCHSARPGMPACVHPNDQHGHRNIANDAPTTSQSKPSLDSWRRGKNWIESELSMSLWGWTLLGCPD